MAFSVAQRTAEIGIRMALAASAARHSAAHSASRLTLISAAW